MEARELKLQPIKFTKEEKHCIVIMIFVNHNIDIKITKFAKMSGVLLRTIQKIKKLLCETRDPQAVISCKKVSHKGIRKVRTTKSINKVQKMVDDNPLRSVVSMAQELQCTDMTVRACVMEDLLCRSYRMQTGQLLTSKMKDRRLLKAHKWMSKLKYSKECLIYS